MKKELLFVLLATMAASGCSVQLKAGPPIKSDPNQEHQERTQEKIDAANEAAKQAIPTPTPTPTPILKK